MPNPASPSSTPASLPLQGPHNMQTESYPQPFPTSIRISRDMSSTVSHDLIDHDSLSSLTLTEDNNLAAIAPWATPNNGDEPPTPPPKSSSHRFGFPPKPSFSSFTLPRHASTSSISVSTTATARPSETFSIHSNDSGRSGRTLDSRKKPSLNPLSLLKKRSQSRLRSDRPAVEAPPPMPSPDLSFHPTPTTPPGSFSKKDRSTRKKKHSYVTPPAVPPKSSLYTLDTNLNEMDGIVDLSALPPANPDSNSPGSGFESSYQSSSDVSSMQFGSIGTSQHSVFSNPFLPGSQRRLAPGALVYDGRRISPKARPPGVQPSVDEGSPSWTAPESWAVEKEGADASITAYSSSDESVNAQGKQATSQQQQQQRTSQSKKKRKSTPGKGLYKVRIYRANNSYHVVSCDLNVTVAQLTPQLNKKLLLDPGVEPHRLHLKERGRERVLAPTERPADIVRRRLEQAGYDYADGLDLLGADDIQFLLKFIYKSNVLGPPEEEMQFEAFDLIDLTSRSLRAVPITLYAHADAIVSLNLSRNPMLEIPLDFIQACTTLRELRLSHMALKRVPQSVRHCRTLQRLDLSCNRIAELDDAGLDLIPQLRHVKLQNNRMEKLPDYFAEMRELRDLNISNNKFRRIPPVVCELLPLVDLDASFNTLTELPHDLGRLTQLEHLIIVGNQVPRIPDSCANLRSLRVLDIRRNPIVDISVVCTLPKIEQLLADHNSMHALDVSFGPALKQLDASHNDITQLTLVPGPLGLPYALTTLNLSHAKLSTLDEMALAQLTALEVLHIDHNSIRSLPESLGGLSRLTHLSCSNNHLYTLPSSIGRLQWLEKLEAHNNDLSELPMSLWNCSSLRVINVTSNVISNWSLPPGSIDLDVNVSHVWGSSVSLLSDRKGSSSSIVGSSLPALASSLEKLYVGENSLTADSLHPLALLKELRVLNLSFNNIQQLPNSFFRNLTHLEELYLSGNDISAIPTENLQCMLNLEVLFLNGNKLQTLPREISKLTKLSVMDVGSNVLKYNINNWEFDWNWNFNTNLRYLNLSGNKRLEIKPDMNHKQSRGQQQLSDFSSLTQLRILGLMDVTIGMQTNIPEESEDRRVRTSMADVNGVAYGIADTLGARGATDQLTMIDLVQPNFRGSPDEAVFAMFGRASYVASNNKLTKFLHDSFLRVFAEELARLQRNETVAEALRRSFLKLNKLLHDYLYSTSGRKMSHVSASAMNQAVHDKIGASGIVLYLVERTLYIANAGNALAVISRQGIAKLVSRKHDPFDRYETARIRAAEGWVSPKGFVNDEIDVSRSFGFYYLLPVVNPRPDVFKYDLTTFDEFVIVGNRGLWDYVSYQTAVDIARKERDPMIAAQKLRDFAISYGAEGTTMIMVIRVSDLFPKNGYHGDVQSSPEPVILPEELIRMVKHRKAGTGIINRDISRLEEEVSPPTGHLALVFTDIRNSTHLWEVNPGMQSAMVLHNNLLRRLLRFCGGYEVKTEGDAFMCSFPTTLSALWWCMSVQTQLLDLPWPLELLECEDGKEIRDGKGRLVARGLSLRMGIHCGQPVCEPDPVTGRMDYFGPMVNRAARVNAVAAGGQIMCSADVVKEINARILESGPPTEYSYLQPAAAIDAIRTLGVRLFPVGEVKLKGLEVPEFLSVLYPKNLESRQDLEAFEAVPTASGSRVQFSVEQMRELGLLCVRLETLAMAKVFRPTPVRKGSVASASASAPEESTESPLVVHDDPSLYLPVMDEKSSDAALTTVLHSLSLRIDNALTKLAFMYMSDIERARGAPDLALRDQILELCRPVLL